MLNELQIKDLSSYYDIIFDMVKENNHKVKRLETKSETFKSVHTPAFPAVDFQL